MPDPAVDEYLRGAERRERRWTNVRLIGGIIVCVLIAAIGASGEPVEGTVCCGLTGAGKGCTIRWGR